MILPISLTSQDADNKMDAAPLEEEEEKEEEDDNCVVPEKMDILIDDVAPSVKVAPTGRMSEAWFDGVDPLPLPSLMETLSDGCKGSDRSMGAGVQYVP